MNGLNVGAEPVDEVAHGGEHLHGQTVEELHVAEGHVAETGGSFRKETKNVSGGNKQQSDTFDVSKVDDVWTSKNFLINCKPSDRPDCALSDRFYEISGRKETFCTGNSHETLRKK
uniref:Uncharacterized protein n=1 Tax=Bursaphelenchus xylophilus TaxID=6326 RepID=A0A1I7S6G0_BURXY